MLKNITLFSVSTAIIAVTVLFLLNLHDNFTNAKAELQFYDSQVPNKNGALDEGQRSLDEITIRYLKKVVTVLIGGALTSTILLLLLFKNLRLQKETSSISEFNPKTKLLACVVFLCSMATLTVCIFAYYARSAEIEIHEGLNDLGRGEYCLFVTGKEDTVSYLASHNFKNSVKIYDENGMEITIRDNNSGFNYGPSKNKISEKIGVVTIPARGSYRLVAALDNTGIDFSMVNSKAQLYMIIGIPLMLLFILPAAFLTFLLIKDYLMVRKVIRIFSKITGVNYEKLLE